MQRHSTVTFRFKIKRRRVYSCTISSNSYHGIILQRTCVTVYFIVNVVCSSPSLCILIIDQCFSIAGPCHQLHRAARGSPGICHFSFLSIFHEYIFYSGNILMRIIFLNVSKSSDPESLITSVQQMSVTKISLVQ